MELHLWNFFAKVVIWSPVLQILIMAIGILISFLVSYHHGNVSIYLPFISETGSVVPEMGIFSWALICGSFFGLILVLFKFSIVVFLIPKEDKKLKLLNNIATIMGIFSMAGLAGVAAFPLSTVIWMHVVVASIHFGCMAGYLFLQTYISFKTLRPYYNRNISIIRLVLASLQLVFVLIMVGCLPFGYSGWMKHYPEKSTRLKTPKDEYYELLFCASLFEWLSYAAYMFFVFTFTGEFRKFVPEMSVRQVDNLQSKHSIDGMI